MGYCEIGVCVLRDPITRERIRDVPLYVDNKDIDVMPTMGEHACANFADVVTRTYAAYHRAAKAKEKKNRVELIEEDPEDKDAKINRLLERLMEEDRSV